MKNTRNNRAIYNLSKNSMAPTCHAEESVIYKYCASLGVKGRKRIKQRKLHIIVIRVNNSNTLIESKPCDHCLMIMKQVGIRKVTYSTKNGELVTETIDGMQANTSAGYRVLKHLFNNTIY